MVEAELGDISPRWDIAETRRLVEEHFGVSQRVLFNQYINPYSHRLYHAKYHFHEVKRLLKEEIDERLPKQDIIDLLLVNMNQFQPILLEIEAHMIACAQGIHSITDIFAHAVYFSLALNLGEKSLKNKEINFKNVIKSITDEKFLKVRNCMSELLDNSLYKDLENLVTQGKHRGLIEPVISINFQENKNPYSLHFPSFVFDEKQQSEREFQEFLSPIYAMTSQMTVNTGILINESFSIKS